MGRMNKETALYKARLYHDKAVTSQIEEDLQVMVRAIIGDYRLEIKHNKDGFDTYPNCKHWEKKYCRSKKKKYCGYLHGRGYVWYGDSEIEIYCNIIASIVGNKIYFPYSSLPQDMRKEDEGK